MDVAVIIFFFQAEDGIRDLVRSRGLGDVYKRQAMSEDDVLRLIEQARCEPAEPGVWCLLRVVLDTSCLLYTSDAADERSSVDLGGRRIIKKKNEQIILGGHAIK